MKLSGPTPQKGSRLALQDTSGPRSAPARGAPHGGVKAPQKPPVAAARTTSLTSLRSNSNDHDTRRRVQVLAESEQVDRFVAEDPLVEIVARDADEEHADRAGAQEDARRDVDVERTALVGRGGRRGSSRDVTGGDVADDRAELEGAKDCVEPYVEDLQDGSEEGDPVEHDVPVVNGHLRLKTILDGGSSPHSSRALSRPNGSS